MKKYYIYSTENDEFLGEVEAESIDAAEMKYIQCANCYSCEIYALSTAPGEAWA